MTTATQLATQAAARFKDPNNRVISASQWLEYLNQAYKKANTSHPMLPWNQSAEETVSVASGIRTGALPANVFQVNWVYDATNDRPLLDLETQGNQWNTDMKRTDSGAPLFYRIRNASVELFPLPDQTISLRMECIEYPAALSALVTTVGSVDGAAAGDHTIAGILVGDVLDKVITVLNASPFTTADVTGEYTITAANTINNAGGTTSVGKRLVAVYDRQSGVGSPVFPAAFHEDLLDGMIALAYLDDGNADQYMAHWKAFEASVAKMNMDVLMFRSQRNPGITDDFFG